MKSQTKRIMSITLAATIIDTTVTPALIPSAGTEVYAAPVTKTENGIVYVVNGESIRIIGPEEGSRPTGEYTVPSTIEGKTVTAIGGWAYIGSGITKLTIPASVTNIGTDAFNVSNLTDVTYLGQIPPKHNINVYNKYTGIIQATYPVESAKAYVAALAG